MGVESQILSNRPVCSHKTVDFLNCTICGIVHCTTCSPVSVSLPTLHHKAYDIPLCRLCKNGLISLCQWESLKRFSNEAGPFVEDFYRRDIAYFLLESLYFLGTLPTVMPVRSEEPFPSFIRSLFMIPPVEVPKSSAIGTSISNEILQSRYKMVPSGDTPPRGLGSSTIVVEMSDISQPDSPFSTFERISFHLSCIDILNMTAEDSITLIPPFERISMGNGMHPVPYDFLPLIGINKNKHNFEREQWILPFLCYKEPENVQWLPRYISTTELVNLEYQRIKLPQLKFNENTVIDEYFLTTCLDTVPEDLYAIMKVVVYIIIRILALYRIEKNLPDLVHLTDSHFGHIPHEFSQQNGETLRSTLTAMLSLLVHAEARSIGFVPTIDYIIRRINGILEVPPEIFSLLGVICNNGPNFSVKLELLKRLHRTSFNYSDELEFMGFETLDQLKTLMSETYRIKSVGMWLKEESDTGIANMSRSATNWSGHEESYVRASPASSDAVQPSGGTPSGLLVGVTNQVADYPTRNKYLKSRFRPEVTLFLEKRHQMAAVIDAVSIICARQPRSVGRLVWDLLKSPPPPAIKKPLSLSQQDRRVVMGPAQPRSLCYLSFGFREVDLKSFNFDLDRRIRERYFSFEENLHPFLEPLEPKDAEVSFLPLSTGGLPILHRIQRTSAFDSVPTVPISSPEFIGASSPVNAAGRSSNTIISQHQTEKDIPAFFFPAFIVMRKHPQRGTSNPPRPSEEPTSVLRPARGDEDPSMGDMDPTDADMEDSVDSARSRLTRGLSGLSRSTSERIGVRSPEDLITIGFEELPDLVRDIFNEWARYVHGKAEIAQAPLSPASTIPTPRVFSNGPMGPQTAPPALLVRNTSHFSASNNSETSHSSPRVPDSVESSSQSTPPLSTLPTQPSLHCIMRLSQSLWDGGLEAYPPSMRPLERNRGFYLDSSVKLMHKDFVATFARPSCAPFSQEGIQETVSKWLRSAAAVQWILDVEFKV